MYTTMTSVWKQTCIHSTKTSKSRVPSRVPQLYVPRGWTDRDGRQHRHAGVLEQCQLWPPHSVVCPQAGGGRPLVRLSDAPHSLLFWGNSGVKGWRGAGWRVPFCVLASRWPRAQGCRCMLWRYTPTSPRVQRTSALTRGIASYSSVKVMHTNAFIYRVKK